MPSRILGIDIGATKISTGLVDLRGDVSIQKKLPTEVRKGKRQILHNLMNAITTYAPRSYRAVGIGIMGAVDWQHGISRSADKLPSGWRHVTLGRTVANLFHVPVTVDNDANAFTLGVAMKEGRRFRRLVGITLGSGIGGGFVMDQRVYHGKDNWVAEFGHTTVDVHSRLRCACGHRGHLETLSSGWGISLSYKKLTGETASPFEIEERFKRGERAALAVYANMVHGLGAGLANIVATYNPDAIAIGGGLSRFRGYVAAGAHDMRTYLLGLPPRRTVILHVKNPEAANIRGAALLTIPRYHIR